MMKLLITNHPDQLVINNWKIRSFRQGFTLIEVLITIAIIGMLLALLVPMVDRSLGKNRVATDAEIFRSKLEEVRLLSGSTQQADESSTSEHTNFDETGYYAIWLHSDAYRSDHYDIVRLSSPVNATGQDVPCKPNDVQTQAWDQSGPCFVERITMSNNVKLSCKVCGPGLGDRNNHFLAFRVPTRQFYDVHVVNGVWVEDRPVFNGSVIELTFSGKTAKVSLEPYTGKVKVTY